MAAELILRNATTHDRKVGNLRSELAWQAARAGDALVGLVARSGELAPVLASVRLLLERPNETLRVVVPRDLADALQRGDWNLIAARDGSGFLPSVQDLNGQFVRQVRLVKERLPASAGEAANAVAHARTHAMLRDVLEKLDVIDKKLDLVLAHQRNESVGKIVSGMQTFKVFASEPGDPASRTASLANALQSLEEGRATLLLDLCARLDAERIEPPWWEPRWSPSEMRAGWLDRHQEDLQWLYGAASTIAAIHVMQNRPGAARSAMDILAAALTPVRATFEALYAHAQYTPDRAAFWTKQFRLLANNVSPPYESADLVFETTVGELSTLAGRGEGAVT